MEIIDAVYGKHKIKEKVLIDLIKTPAVQRLKGIRQQGLPKEWHYGVEFMRYDHSIGVMVLLDRLGAPIKEQIAGLLHDISHTAFSHVYDYYINNNNESHGDDVFEKYIKKNKEIMKILKKYKYKIKDITDFKGFTLLENNLPDLCADRIDYTLRELLFFKKDKKKVTTLYKNLTVVDGEIVFKNKKSAKEFYGVYKYFAENHWGGIKHMINYMMFVKVLKKAIKLKLIEEDDFNKTDDYILERIKKSNNKTIVNNIEKLKTKNIKIPKKYTGFIGKNRKINPKYIASNKLLYSLDNKK